ncbi:MAG: DUF4124 domain-containing protein, partial [Candidatus Tectomicrobia bacterium]|nr:DUF4124 domain-containing protein [Candidatus Tectomicrobia bacterium]
MLRYGPGLFLMVLLLGGLASPLEATVYRWVDKQGKVHYTDDFSKIPAGARWEEKALPELSLPPASTPTTSPEATPTPSPAGTLEGSGKTPAGTAPPESQAWQKMLVEVQGKLSQRLQEKEKLEAELRRPKYKEMVRQERQLKGELDRIKGEIEALKAQE